MSDKPSRILLVEDNDADVYLFRKALEIAGVNFELTVIGDGAEALAFICGEGLAPDLAVLDLNLPKNDGAQVLEAMRASARFANTPVVIASSSAEAPAFLRREHSRVAHYFRKPPDLEEFLQIGPVLKELLREAARAR